MAATLAPPPPGPPGMGMTSLDAAMFPSIMDSIIAYSDRPTRLTLRQASREQRDRVDAALCSHLSLCAEGLISLTTDSGETVPCVRATSARGERLPGLKWSAYDAAERARFLALLKHARTLDLEGRGHLASLSAHLTNVRTVRCKRRGSDVPLPFACNTLESSVTLQCQADVGVGGMRWRQPPIAEALLAPSQEGGVSTWKITVNFDPEEPGLVGARIGLRAPTSVRHVVLVYRPLEGGALKRSRDEIPEPRQLGILADAVAMAAHCIERARFTIAIDARNVQPHWVSSGREVAPGELTGAVYRAVRSIAAEVIGYDGVESAMARFRFVGELDDE